MARQVERYRPRAAVMATGAACDALRARLTSAGGTGTVCGAGSEALIALVTRDDVKKNTSSSPANLQVPNSRSHHNFT